MMPLIHKSSSKLGIAQIIAFLAANEFYKNESFMPFVDCCGATYIAKNELEMERFKESSAKFKNLFRLDKNELFIKKAMQISPLKLREFLANSLKIDFNTEFLGFKKCENVYKIHTTKGEYHADIIVLAGGASANGILNGFDESLLLSAVRGQTTILAPFSANHVLPLSQDGYICKAANSTQIIGSSFDRENLSLEIRKKDNIENLEKISAFLCEKPENLKILGANVGLRSYSGDRFMLVSQLHDFNSFCNDYKALLWQKNKMQILPKPRYENGVFISSAHGAHGLSTAILAAEIIADLALNRPLCVTHSLFSEFHSARFLIRKLKKGLLK